MLLAELDPRRQPTLEAGVLSLHELSGEVRAILIRTVLLIPLFEARETIDVEGEVAVRHAGNNRTDAC